MHKHFKTIIKYDQTRFTSFIISVKHYKFLHNFVVQAELEIYSQHIKSNDASVFPKVSCIQSFAKKTSFNSLLFTK